MVDRQLFDRAQSALDRAPYVLRRAIRLEAQQGRVVLSGTVRSFFHKQLAQEALRDVDGLNAIDNRLQVDWQAPVESNEALESSASV